VASSSSTFCAAGRAALGPRISGVVAGYRLLSRPAISAISLEARCRSGSRTAKARLFPVQCAVRAGKDLPSVRFLLDEWPASVEFKTTYGDDSLDNDGPPPTSFSAGFLSPTTPTASGAAATTAAVPQEASVAAAAATAPTQAGTDDRRRSLRRSLRRIPHVSSPTTVPSLGPPRSTIWVSLYRRRPHGPPRGRR
jgi:hypothetical protein